VQEPLTPATAKRLLLEIIASGRVDISGHAWIEMDADGLTVQDVFHVLRGGVVEPGEFERGSWRYGCGRVATSRWWNSTLKLGRLS
jgi:hypothetical protein